MLLPNRGYDKIGVHRLVIIEQRHESQSEMLSDVTPVTALYYEYDYSTSLSDVLESTGYQRKTARPKSKCSLNDK
jgi:hypothetical protein